MKKKMIGGVILGSAILLLFSPILSAVNAAKIEPGKKVTLYYKLFVSGHLLETADAKEPFTYQHGQHQIVPGLEKGLNGLHVGDKKTIQVASQDAYGPVDLKAFREIEKTKIPVDIAAKVGTLLEARSPQGQVMLVKIKEVKAKTVVIDFNHPLAGKDLEFQIEVIKIA